jgi:hypothetical protein
MGKHLFLFLEREWDIMEHHFNIEVASQYGVNEAIFCSNLYFWVKQNEANKKHFYDGRFWTYNSMEAYTKLFPYWTIKQIRTVIDNCEKKGLIIKGNYNKKGYDRTTWYALTDVIYVIYEGEKYSNIKKCPNGQMDVPKKANGNAQKGTPIPDSKPNKKTNNKLTTTSTTEIIEEFKKENNSVPVEEIAEALLKDDSFTTDTKAQFKACMKLKIQDYQKAINKPKKATGSTRKKPIRVELIPDYMKDDYVPKEVIAEDKAELEAKHKAILDKLEAFRSGLNQNQTN